MLGECALSLGLGNAGKDSNFSFRIPLPLPYQKVVRSVRHWPLSEVVHNLHSSCHGWKMASGQFMLQGCHYRTCRRTQCRTCIRGGNSYYLKLGDWGTNTWEVSSVSFVLNSFIIPVLLKIVAVLSDPGAMRRELPIFLFVCLKIYSLFKKNLRLFNTSLT